MGNPYDITLQPACSPQLPLVKVEQPLAYPTQWGGALGGGLGVEIEVPSAEVHSMQPSFESPKHVLNALRSPDQVLGGSLNEGSNTALPSEYRLKRSDAPHVPEDMSSSMPKVSSSGMVCSRAVKTHE